MFLRYAQTLVRRLPLRTRAGKVAVGTVSTRRSVSTQLRRLLCRARIKRLASVAIVTGDADAAVDRGLGVEARAAPRHTPRRASSQLTTSQWKPTTTTNSGRPRTRG